MELLVQVLKNLGTRGAVLENDLPAQPFCNEKTQGDDHEQSRKHPQEPADDVTKQKKPRWNGWMERHILA